MLQISESKSIFQREELYSYEQFSETLSIRKKTTGALLAKTMFTWLSGQISSIPVQISTLAERVNVVKSQEKLFTALLLSLKEEGYLHEEAGFVKKASFDEIKLDKLVNDLGRKGLATYGKGDWLTNTYGPFFELAQSCIPKLPEVLRGEMSGVQLLFSPDNYSRTMATYTNHVPEVYYGLIAEQIVDKCHKIWALRPEHKIRILEIGAGSGYGTIRMLEGLQEHSDKVHFCFTDIGNSFLRRAKRTFKQFDCELEFRLLDISKDSTEQGFAKESFDIVFATNVLHATPDLRVTVGNVRDLLAPEGSVYINEIATESITNTVTYGTTPGWWLSTDGLRIPYTPVASTTTFRNLLAEIGFKDIEVFGYPGIPESELPQAIIQGVKKSIHHE